MAFIPQDQNPSMKPSFWGSADGNDEALLDALNQVVDRGAESLMILSCSANNHSAQHLSGGLKSCAIPVCRAVFPSVFFADKKLDTGFIIVGLPFSISVKSYSLNDSTFEVDGAAVLHGYTNNKSQDLLVFIDAMANTTEAFISKLFESIGGGMDVIGGGAGSVDFIQNHAYFPVQVC